MSLPEGKDAHGAHASPAKLPEPNTPMWLPALGGILLLCVGIWFEATATPTESTAHGASSSAQAEPGGVDAGGGRFDPEEAARLMRHARERRGER